MADAARVLDKNYPNAGGDFDATLGMLKQGPKQPSGYESWLYDNAPREGEPLWTPPTGALWPPSRWVAGEDSRIGRHLDQFGYEAPRQALPGYARGQDAYNAYSHGNYGDAAWHAGLGTLELGAPIALGAFAKTMRPGSLDGGYGPLRGEGWEASKAIGAHALPSGLSPALWGIGARANVPFVPEKGWGSSAAIADDLGSRIAPILPPRSWEGVSLSPNARANGDGFYYTIYRDGKPFGTASGFVGGDKAYVDWLGSHRRVNGKLVDANGLGVSGIKQLREDIRRDFPQVKYFEGRRISGARRGPAAAPDNNRNQRVRMDEWMLPVGGGGLTAGALLDEHYGE